MGNNSFSKYIEKVTGSVAAFDMSQMMAMFAGSGNSSNGTGGFDWASMFGGNGTGFPVMVVMVLDILVWVVMVPATIPMAVLTCLV